MGELVEMDASFTAPASALNGRNLSIARRVALSAGKAGLPPPADRVGRGHRGAAPPPPAPSVAPKAPPAPAAEILPPAPAARPAPPTLPQATGLSGRDVSIQHRRLAAAGKAALKGATSLAPSAPMAPPMSGAVPVIAQSAHVHARMRRAVMAQSGRGSAPPARPSRPGREGSLEYAPKVIASVTQAGQPVTGLRIGQGRTVTGDERGFGKPVSGTQYLPAEDGASFRAAGPKVGLASTPGGQVVSGTLVRSGVRITGDEAGQKTSITGKVDQRPEHDLTQRKDAGGFTAAQFERQANPHGTTVFGTNLGRSMKSAGSRERTRVPAVESTEGGLVITGSALGRSLRVTGDENGACRSVTGTQYMAPARRQAACGHRGGGTAPPEQLGEERADPVTVKKVTVAQSWGGQRVTGPDIEHNPRVTGDEPGSCSMLTGSQYQGPATGQGLCEAATGQGMATRLRRAPADAPVTGNIPMNAGSVTGTARGASRDITGTPYYRKDAEIAARENPVAAIDSRFSIRTPQRSAQLVAAQTREAAPPAPERVTGSCAVGAGKVTGNLEFLARTRSRAADDRKPAHAGVTGEGGATLAKRITGDSWADNRHVTGQENAFAAERNPTERGPKAKAFAGTGTFKQLAAHEEPKQLVTGMMGYFSKTGARVTLSGGAQS